MSEPLDPARAELCRAAIAMIAAAADQDPALIGHETNALVDVVLARLEPIADELGIRRPVVLQLLEVTVELAGIMAAIAATALLDNAQLASPPDAGDDDVRAPLTRLLAAMLDELGG